MQTEAMIDAPSTTLHLTFQQLKQLRSEAVEQSAKLSRLHSHIEELEQTISSRIVNGETTGDRLADFGHVCHHDDPKAASQLVEQLKQIENRLLGQNGQLILIAESNGRDQWLNFGRLVGEELFFKLEDKEWALPTDGHVDFFGLVKSDMPLRLNRKTEPWKASFQSHGRSDHLELSPSSKKTSGELTHDFIIGDEAVLERLINFHESHTEQDKKNQIRHFIKCLRMLGIDPGKYPMLIDSLKEDREQCLEKIASLKVGRDRYRMENEQEVTRSVSDEAAVKVRGVVRELKLCLIQAVDLGLEDNPLVKSLREEYQL